MWSISIASKKRWTIETLFSFFFFFFFFPHALPSFSPSPKHTTGVARPDLFALGPRSRPSLLSADPEVEAVVEGTQGEEDALEAVGIRPLVARGGAALCCGGGSGGTSCCERRYRLPLALGRGLGLPRLDPRLGRARLSRRLDASERGGDGAVPRRARRRDRRRRRSGVCRVCRKRSGRGRSDDGGGGARARCRWIQLRQRRGRERRAPAPHEQQRRRRRGNRGRRRRRCRWRR